MDKFKIGLIGLGRLGRKYAEILNYKIKNCELIAVSSLVDSELDYAQRVLGIRQVYSDYRQLLVLNELDAVFVLSTSDQHTRHIIESIEAGLHVFSEKPIATNVTDALKVIKVANRMQSQTTVVGFVRRYDASYQYAYEKVEQGIIGQPFMIRSQTADKENEKTFNKEFVRTSGGIFLDFNVHDIDLARWFLKSEFSKVYSNGGVFKLQKYREIDGADYVQSIATLENGSMAHISASRISAHGHDTFTEIIGTEGSIRIGMPATKNRVEIFDKSGIRRDAVNDFYERFEDAFHKMSLDFIESIQKGRKLTIKLEDALEATRVAVAMTKSFVLNTEVELER